MLGQYKHERMLRYEMPMHGLLFISPKNV